MAKVLKGATFNLEYGRNPQVVRKEVNDLIDKHELDFVVVQEAGDYFDVLRKITNFEYFTNRAAGHGGKQVGILVKDSHKVDRVKYRSMGDGWRTVDGKHHAPAQCPSVRIDGWLHVMGVHLPTPSVWKNGKLTGPADRVDDYLLIAQMLTKWFRYPAKRSGRIAAGDWNEPPFTSGAFSPKWIAKQVKGFLAYPLNSKEGHGIIDYVLGKGVEIHPIRKDLKVTEKSDHEPVVFTVRK